MPELPQNIRRKKSEPAVNSGDIISKSPNGKVVLPWVSTTQDLRSSVTPTFRSGFLKSIFVIFG